MVNRFPPDEEGGAPNPLFDGAGAPNGFDELPDPDGGSPAFGVAGEAGWDPNMNELPVPEPGLVANGEGWPNVEGLLGVEPF